MRHQSRGAGESLRLSERGKRFEALIFERQLVGPLGRRGRVDIVVQSDPKMIGLGGIKGTDWDKVKLHRVRRLALRHARQIRRYAENHLDEGLDVCPGVIYPKAPRSPAKKALVEETLNSKMIQCVWRRD